MQLKNLLQKLQENNIPYKIQNSKFRIQDIQITAASLNSKHLKGGWAFFALPGEKTDGSKYVKEAIQNGANVVFAPSSIPFSSVPIIEIPNLNNYLETIASLIYDVNLQDFYLIGVTGTNGKTTTAYAIEHILNYCATPCAKLGTVEYTARDYVEKSILTTPDILTVYRVLSEAKKRSVRYVVMEMSSHGLVQQRIPIYNFKQAIFTNIGHDHLDYHKNFEDYRNAKMKLFKYMDKTGFAIINVDDENHQFFVHNSNGAVITYGKNKNADVRIGQEKLSIWGTEFSLQYNGKQYKVNTKLIGLHNIYNLTAAFISCFQILKSLLSLNGNFESSIVDAILKFDSPPGRLEKVETKDYNIYIDYAHTHGALQNVLVALNQLKNEKSRIICVFGCGGDRDKAKRPLMGEIATKFSDIAIITSDNPRTEDPQSIIEDIKAGIKNTARSLIFEEVDRKKAIKKAIYLAKADDIILIAGKGHEDYQIFKDKTIHFSDKEIVLECIQVKE